MGSRLASAVASVSEGQQVALLARLAQRASLSPPPREVVEEGLLLLEVSELARTSEDEPCSRPTCA